MVIIHYMKLLPNLSECARHQLIFFFFFFGIKHPANPLLLEQGLKGLILNFTLTRIKRKLKPKELFSLKQTSIPCMAATHHAPFGLAVWNSKVLFESSESFSVCLGNFIKRASN